jgi:hypothetical protein
MDFGMPVFLTVKNKYQRSDMLRTRQILLCATFSLPKLKSVTKGTHFRSTEVIHEKTADWLKAISQNNFTEYFDA